MEAFFALDSRDVSLTFPDRVEDVKLPVNEKMKEIVLEWFSFGFWTECFNIDDVISNL